MKRKPANSGESYNQARGMPTVPVARFPRKDMVNHPPHYNNHPSGVECHVIAEPFGYYLGNAVKYIWRCGLKHDAIEDLKKARWYLDEEIKKRERAGKPTVKTM